MSNNISLVNYKRKGILFEEDKDEPIDLPDQADDKLIREYMLPLIGKILKPKNQNMEKLIGFMPHQCGMQEKTTSSDHWNGHSC